MNRDEYQSGAKIKQIVASSYRVPTDAPESDGTFAWHSTTLVVVHATAGGVTGVGFTYADAATAEFIVEHLAQAVMGRDPCAIPAAWSAMVGTVRNLGRPGVASMAISAVDAALWDLKGRLWAFPLSR